ncbi:hypothetical protein [Nonomuraea sp. NPDC050783]|uniref:hypothetical protein n=1 Tax=Nonomuraea sp. NPDC050783 TaxID=3154634 RepID=UPI0034659CB8
MDEFYNSQYGTGSAGRERATARGDGQGERGDVPGRRLGQRGRIADGEGPGRADEDARHRGQVLRAQAGAGDERAALAAIGARLPRTAGAEPARLHPGWPPACTAGVTTLVVAAIGLALHHMIDDELPVDEAPAAAEHLLPGEGT